MKLHDSQIAPNPRRVRFFLAEKGVEVPTVQVNIGTGEHQTDEFKKLNPLARVPVLELDDGTGLAESVAICRYFEETHPDPPLMGVDAEDKALVEMWNRRMELEVLSNVAGCFRNTNDFFKGRISQVAEYGELCRKAAHQRVAWLDEVLADSAFIAGDRFTIADITAVVGIDFGRLIDLRVLPEQKNLTRWHEAVSARPAASA